MVLVLALSGCDRSERDDDGGFRITHRRARCRTTGIPCAMAENCAAKAARDILPVADQKWLRRFRASASRSEEHTSELQSLMRISYAVSCLPKKTKPQPEYT